MYARYLQKIIGKRGNDNKAIIIIGARQVGKTTLVKSILKGKEFLFLDGDNPAMRTVLDNPNT